MAHRLTHPRDLCTVFVLTHGRACCCATERARARLRLGVLRASMDGVLLVHKRSGRTEEVMVHPVLPAGR